MISFLTILYGLLFGSFLNVCIYRIPRKESIAFPPSHCPNCQQPIKAYDNVPVLSFLMLRGKCRSCKAAISWRYPMIEMLTAFLFWCVVTRFSVTWAAAAYLILTAMLIVISLIDFDFMIIPDVISLPGMLLGLAASFVIPRDFSDALFGMLLGGGMIWSVGMLGERVFKKEAIPRRTKSTHGIATLFPRARYLALSDAPGISVHPSGNSCSRSHSIGVRRRATMFCTGYVSASSR